MVAHLGIPKVRRPFLFADDVGLRQVDSKYVLYPE